MNYEQLRQYRVFPQDDEPTWWPEEVDNIEKKLWAYQVRIIYVYIYIYVNMYIFFVYEEHLYYLYSLSHMVNNSSDPRHPFFLT